MSRPWMPLYVADYLRDTRRLTAAEHGAYLLLIMEYWTAGELPDDDKQLCRICCMTPAEWRRARPNVQGFFADGWKHKRIDAELARSAEISSKRSNSAKLRHSNSSANAHANAEHLDTHAGATSQPQSQSPTKKDPPLRVADGWPDDFGDQFWQTYPRKTDKLAAMKKLASVRKQGLVTWPDLMAGVQRYAAVPRDPQYTKQPTTWLNAGCWADEIQTGGDNGYRTGNPRQTGHDAILAAATRKARELDRDGEMARPADTTGFAFGDGVDRGGSRGNDIPVERTAGGDHRVEPDGERVREGEIIPPDQDAAWIPGGRRFVG